jgi:hypothetical protein
MSYNFTHALVGLTALQHTNEAVSALVRANLGEFLIGTMGPDPYFGDAMPKPLFTACRTDLARMLHALDVRVLFAALLPLAENCAPKQAYVLGFLCHFLLDTNAHPYIDARFFGAVHSPTEIQIDLMMTARAGYAGVPAQPRLFYKTRHLSMLDELHAQLVFALFSLETRGAFARGYRKWITVNTLSYDPNNRKLRFFSKIEKRFGTPGKITSFLVSHHPDPDDRLNLRKAAWNAPWGDTQTRTESFIDLFDRACSEAPDLMNAVLSAMQDGDNADVMERIGARRMDARPV